MDRTTLLLLVMLLATCGATLLIGPMIFYWGRRYQAALDERDAAAFEAHVATTPVPVLPVRSRIRNPKLTPDAHLRLAGAREQARDLTLPPEVALFVRQQEAAMRRHFDQEDHQ